MLNIHMKFPASRDEIVKMMKKIGCSEEKIHHSMAVADLAMRIADEVIKDGIRVDKNVVEHGALLHDIGLVKTQVRTRFDEHETAAPEHAVLGARMSLEMGFPKEVAHCIEAHEPGAGFSREEAAILKLPEAVVNYTPTTWEAKIVIYADLAIYWAVEKGIDIWNASKSELAEAVYPYVNLCFKGIIGKDIDISHPAIKRVLKLNSELIKYIKPEMLPPLWDDKI